jgi:hypothetical protein
MNRRTAREISVNEDLINNKNIRIKIGTAENRNFPETIYINCSFWVKAIENIFENAEKSKYRLKSEIQHIFNKKITEFLKNSKILPFNKDNIYICNIPENFNYNDKYNFIYLEIYLHTINLDSEIKYPLNNKKDVKLFDEAINLSNIIGNELLKLESNFYLNKKSR